MRRLAPVVMLMGAASIPIQSGEGCWLDHASVVFVPPHTSQILATYRCGFIVCWERWIEADGIRRGASRVCETPIEARDQLVPGSPAPP